MNLAPVIHEHVALTTELATEAATRLRTRVHLFTQDAQGVVPRPVAVPCGGEIRRDVGWISMVVRRNFSIITTTAALLLQL